MIDIYSHIIGNPDSRTHTFGTIAYQVVENARKQVVDLLSVRTDEVYFINEATESNNIVIQGLREYGLKNGKRHIIVLAIEHKAVLNAAKIIEQFGFESDTTRIIHGFFHKTIFRVLSSECKQIFLD